MLRKLTHNQVVWDADVTILEGGKYITALIL